MRQSPRIALAGIILESNAFAPPTIEGNFRALCWLEGDAILHEAARTTAAMPAEMVSFIRAWNSIGAWRPVPLLIAAAEPGGPADQVLFERLLEEIRSRLLAALPVDAVYVAAHGAMTATEEHDPDGVLLAAIRDVVGPDVPIVATLDLHANLSERMVTSTDLLIGYRTNPHIDQKERGVEAAHSIAEMLTGTRHQAVHVKLPFTPASIRLLTTSGPFADVMQQGQQAVDSSGGLLANVTLLGGCVFSDTPKNGVSVLVSGRWRLGQSDEAGRTRAFEAANTLARDLGRKIWTERERYLVQGMMPFEQAARLARQLSDDPARPSVILADVADNAGGGAPSNTTWLIEEIRSCGAQGVILGNFWDPQLAAEAQRRGLGARFEAVLNRDGSSVYSSRYAAEATVVSLHDGKVVGGPGIWHGRALDVGPSAALDFGGLIVGVVSKRKQCADPVFFTMHGLDPATARVVVVKSRGHFRAAFEPLFSPERIIEVDAPGLASPILTRHPFRHLPRPVYPFDLDTHWQG